MSFGYLVPMHHHHTRLRARRDRQGARLPSGRIRCCTHTSWVLKNSRLVTVLHNKEVISQSHTGIIAASCLLRTFPEIFVDGWLLPTSINKTTPFDKYSSVEPNLVLCCGVVAPWAAKYSISGAPRTEFRSSIDTSIHSAARRVRCFDIKRKHVAFTVSKRFRKAFSQRHGLVPTRYIISYQVKSYSFQIKSN